MSSEPVQSCEPAERERPLVEEGANVVIFGGSSGIGLGVARYLAVHGAHVTLVGRKQEKLEEAIASIRAEGGQAASYALDVRQAEPVQDALEKNARDRGELDLVVAAAAGNFFVPAAELSPKGFRTVVEVDLIGTFNVFSAAFPRMRKPGGAMVAISAPQAQRAMQYQAHACAAKAGVDMLVKCLALEWGAHGVRVNAVSPGPIAETEGLSRLSASPEIERAVRDNTALRRFGSVDDIARAVAFLASDQAAYVTGTVLDCDGGMRLGNFAVMEGA